MHGHREPSFLATKEKPAPIGKDDGLMILVARDSLMYFSIVSLSRWTRLYSLLIGNEDPGREDCRHEE